MIIIKFQKKNGLSNLLDSKLVNLDSLKNNSKNIPNQINFGGNNNNTNFKFY